MNFACAFHAADRDQFERWAAWVEELGGMGSHGLFIMPARGVPLPKCNLPHTIVRDSYGISTNWASNEAHRDAAGANSMLRQFAWFFSDKGPFMFIEPDAIPMRPGWHDEIAAEYAACGKAFMGARITGVPGQYPTHSTGNMVLPQNASHIEKLMIATRGPNGFEVAFDVAAAERVLANFHNTAKIQQIFRGEPFTTHADLERIRPEVAIFHNSKDGSLIERLRERSMMSVDYSPQPKEVGATFGISTPASMLSFARAMDVEDDRRRKEIEHSVSKPIVHTYCSWFSDPTYRAEQEAVVKLWEKNWRDAGWDTRILTEDDAKRHPDYEKFRNAFEALPTVNPKHYEMAAWMRHVAMACVGGLLVDYDTLNKSCHSGFDRPEERFPQVLSDKNPVPFAITGTKEQFQNAIEAFLTCQPVTEKGALHLSDMHCVQQLKFRAFDNAVEWNDPRASDAAMLHFGHYSCAPRKRSEVMRNWMEGGWEGSIGVANEPTVLPAPVRMHEGDTRHEEMLRCGDGPDIERAMIPEARHFTVKELIEGLVHHGKKDGFAIGRIRKQLRAAKLIK